MKRPELLRQLTVKWTKGPPAQRHQSGLPRCRYILSGRRQWAGPRYLPMARILWRLRREDHGVGAFRTGSRGQRGVGWDHSPATWFPISEIPCLRDKQESWEENAALVSGAPTAKDMTETSDEECCPPNLKPLVQFCYKKACPVVNIFADWLEKGNNPSIIVHQLNYVGRFMEHSVCITYEGMMWIPTYRRPTGMWILLWEYIMMWRIVNIYYYMGKMGYKRIPH